MTFSFLLIGCCEIDSKTVSWLVRSHLLCWNFVGPRLNAAHFLGTYLEMFSFFVRCGWGVQEGDPWHPRSVRPFPVSGWPTPCGGQEIRWTGSPLTLPKVLPLTFLFTCSWRSIKSISLMEHFKLFLLFFFLLLFHWFWTCYSIVHYGKSNLGIVSVVCALEWIGPNRQGFPKYSFTCPQESYACYYHDIPSVLFPYQFFLNLKRTFTLWPILEITPSCESYTRELFSPYWRCPRND